MEKIIKEVAEKYSIPVNLVKAVVFCESADNTFAIRYEPHYKWLYKPKYFSSRNIISDATEIEAQKTSWGLMQVMGAVARERGFTGAYLSELVMPEVGLEYGCKHLKLYYNKYKNWKDAVASYNAGSPRKKDNGEYVNQYYVDKVFKKAGDLGGL